MDLALHVSEPSIESVLTNISEERIDFEKKQNETPLLSITDLSKCFTVHAANKQIQACRDINIQIMRGEFIGITGRSGSGKSTILRCVYGTNLCETGAIEYDSAAYGLVDLANISQRQMVYLRKHEIGYVTQFLNALPRRSAYDIVLQSALETHGTQNLEYCHEETTKILCHFDLERSLWDVYPQTFSGGEKLRLNIAAAMIKKPRLLLLDEPTASLDKDSKLKVRSLIEDLKEQGTTMLGIFHDLEFMEGLCDQEFNMQKGMIC